MIYISSPYTTVDPSRTEEDNYQDVAVFTAELIRRDFAAYSPIVHCHKLKVFDETIYEIWSSYNKKMIAAASSVYVLMLPFWLQSVGVRGEIEYAHANGKPVWFWTLEPLGSTGVLTVAKLEELREAWRA